MMPFNFLLYRTLMTALDIYMYIVIAAVAATWLVAFNAINLRHPVIRTVVDILRRLTEPLFQAIRRVIPPVGGLDLSPIVVFLGIVLIKRVVTSLMMQYGM